VALAGDGDVMLLHGLQQRRLGARAGAVDLVAISSCAKDRAAHEAEGAAAVGRFLQDLRAQDVGRHQVRRELNAAGAEPEHRAHRVDKLGLRQTRDADQQAVPSESTVVSARSRRSPDRRSRRRPPPALRRAWLPRRAPPRRSVRR
jgi:hypothetical protein